MLGGFLEEENKKEGEQEERRSINTIVFKKKQGFRSFFGILFKVRNLWSGNIWYLRNGRIFGAKLQEDKSSSPNNGGGGDFLKQALDGLHPQGAWSHQRMTSLAPTFLFVFIHLLATNSLLPPRTSLSPRGVLTLPTLFLLNMEGGDTHKEETDRQTGGGGVVFHTATIRPKVSPARTLGPGRVGIMYKWQMQATSSHLCEPNFPEPISYNLLSIIRWSMCQSVLHQKITRPSDLVK